eukprot:TRINITY_DN2026_c0_g1_i4.p1 TRINITY_DN2026_c0_g1~~TRINITY_DN2026_c0_g1_i4.p1  ORF type:complete len:415 (+),score=93.50 TRINITY_DN2026_c0_g1_i4:56-1300(+)
MKGFGREEIHPRFHTANSPAGPRGLNPNNGNTISISVDPVTPESNHPTSVVHLHHSASVHPVPQPVSSPTASSPKAVAQDDDIYFLGFDLSLFSRTTQFMVFAGGVFLFYFAYAMSQEFIFKRVEGFVYGLYLTFIQFIVYVVISGHQKLTSQVKEERKAPLKAHALIGFLSVSTMGLSNVACQYLNYPTQVMFKSCKLIPVMIMGVVFLGKRYSRLDYLAMVSLTMGMVIFSVGDSFVSTSFDPTGVLLICIALVADALIGNAQEKVMTTYKASTTEMIFYSKGIGCFILFLALVVTGELRPAFTFCWNHPRVYLYILFMASVGCGGEFFVMALVKQFGALIAVTVTSSRKLMSIMVSFILFPKPFTMIYLLGTFQVFVGIGLEVYLKNTKAINQLFEQWKVKYFSSHVPSKV